MYTKEINHGTENNLINTVTYFFRQRIKSVRNSISLDQKKKKNCTADPVYAQALFLDAGKLFSLYTRMLAS